MLRMTVVRAMGSVVGRIRVPVARMMTWNPAFVKKTPIAVRLSGLTSAATLPANVSAVAEIISVAPVSLV